MCTDVREETADTQKASPVYAPVNSVGQRQRVGAASVETAKFETVLGSALALNLQATLLHEQAYQFQFVYTSKTFLAFNPPYLMTYAKKINLQKSPPPPPPQKKKKSISNPEKKAKKRKKKRHTVCHTRGLIFNLI